MHWSRPSYALVLALVVVGPLMRPGYLLLRDAVSTPRSYLSDTALGLTSAPRATPQDFAVALASHLVDGGVVVKASLILGLWLAGWGAARLVATALPSAGVGGQFVAITLAAWNPYVAERLLQGHWSLLVGYGCLPWVAEAMLTLRSAAGASRPGSLGFFALACWIALAGLTPTGLLLAATVALVCVAAPVEGPGGRPRWLCAAATLGSALGAALPWLTAAAVGTSLTAHTATNALGVTVFAPRAEPGLGTLASLASLGGIWNAEAVPTSRTTLFALLSAAVLLGVVVAGLPVAARRPAVVPLLGLAAVSVLAPAALATGPGLDVLAAVVDAVPGLGVLRDGQKWMALAVPGYALAGAGAVVTLRRWLGPSRPRGSAVTALACCLALMLALPDLAWGVWGKVAPVHYPSGWAAVAATINDRGGPGWVAVLPAGTMRRFSWSGAAPVLDPLPRWVRADVLTTGDLVISGVMVAGEGHHARAVQDLLLAGADPSALAAAGVAWLVVESDTAGDRGASARTLAALTPIYRDDAIALYRIGGHSAGAPAASRRALLIAAHLAWLAMLIVGAVGTLLTGCRGRWVAPRHLNHVQDTPKDIAED
ncbi:membrane protein [Mycobacterium haemophilum]|uniref:Membrane protein n=1 Tax=Mycobacterium haemophilum TaxID=29311 RepID=A0A0I9YAZ4_9MYCO|nr:membrane protein [Mycobacterium haemophilum]KLO25452.1 membrane protein [Mycobacterium haemophilum]KLO34172.1 membrane protein [Mycobacterium haemophilum]KLO37037.1 membrane protein [Mycobacterium haemophilum]KLO43338.1 membrane protein [Mycobacterium haemophilum]